MNLTKKSLIVLHCILALILYTVTLYSVANLRYSRDVCLAICVNILSNHVVCGNYPTTLKIKTTIASYISCG